MVFRVRIAVSTILGLATCTVLVGMQLGCQASRGLDEPEADRLVITAEIRQDVNNPDYQTSTYAATTSQSIVGRAERVVPRPPVILGPGDVIEVKFFYTPELNVTQVVRPDGKIALQLIGEVTAEGVTPGQLRDQLLRLYMHHLKDPQIAVLVQSFHDRRVFVGGQVTKPGTVEMPAEMTVVEAIMWAGGFDLREAEIENVVVIRREGGHWRGYKLNMKPTLEGAAVQPFLLQPKDIVYVPRTKIAKVDQWVEQHINRLIPRVPFYFNAPVGN